MTSMVSPGARSLDIMDDVRFNCSIREIAKDDLNVDLILMLAIPVIMGISEIFLYLKFVGNVVNFPVVALSGALPFFVSGLGCFVADKLFIAYKIDHSTNLIIKESVALTAYIATAIVTPILLGPVGLLGSASAVVKGLMLSKVFYDMHINARENAEKIIGIR